MKCRIKYYRNIFEACEDKDRFFVTLYADSKKELLSVVDVISNNYTVVNVYLDEDKKEEKSE